MLAQDLILDSSTTIAAGTSNSTTYSLLGSNAANQSMRSVAASSTTNPATLRIAHSMRMEKGFKTVANQAVPASDVIFDRRLIRLDRNVAQTTHLDPTNRINDSVQIVFENPRLGTESSTVQARIDMLLAVVAMLRASTNANAVRFFNGET